MKSILDPSFRYTPSISTDISKTFSRVRREQQKVVKVASKSPGKVRLALVNKQIVEVKS